MFDCTVVRCDYGMRRNGRLQTFAGHFKTCTPPTLNHEDRDPLTVNEADIRINISSLSTSDKELIGLNIKYSKYFFSGP